MRYILSTLVVLIGLLACLIGELTGDKSTLIRTSNGPIKGEHYLSSWTNQTIYSFKGISYASPPVGDLRFKDPVPSEKWSQVRDCTKEQAICPQTPSAPSIEHVHMSEDCLYLNVYTPQLPTSGRELLPVMVWIHGGSFLEGSGNFDQNGPDLLVAEGVVFVTLNYRLGALGFLTLDIHETPGNSGLKDQRLALLWVQSEIQHFGGDPRQVTIFGESAGSVSVHLQYLSPLSVGLFQRAIGNSGSTLAHRVRDNGSRYARQLAKYLNCNADDTTEILTCLRAADHKDIVKAQALVEAPQDFKTGLTVFVPTIDKDTSKEPFLPDFPITLEKQRTGSHVPFLMGFNSDEGILRLFRSEEEIRNITNNLEYLNALQVPESNSCSTKLKAERIGNFYFRVPGPSQLNDRGYVDVYTDVLYAYATLISARLYQSRSNTFLYYFSFNGKFKNKYFERIGKKYNISGVAHTEDLNYLFVQKDDNWSAADNNEEIATRQRMVKMWTNFAKHGTPTVGPDPLLQNVQWLPASGGRTNHLHIDANLRMVSEDLLAPRAALWDSITFHHCS